MMFEQVVIVIEKSRIFRYLLLPLVLTAVVPELSVANEIDRGWYKHLDDSCCGINLDGARRFIAERGLKPRTPVVVGIVDSGIDTASVDLRPALWCNPKEKKNGRDDDNNGYVDDVHGWNFLGTSDGSFNMTSAGTEEYREFKRLFPKYKGADSTNVADPAEYKYYLHMRRKAGIDSYLKFFAYNAMKGDAYNYIDSVARSVYGTVPDTMSIMTVSAAAPDDERFVESFQMLFFDLSQAGGDSSWNKLVSASRDNLALMARRINGIEHDADKRLLMGDDLKDADDIYYGNPCLQADDCEHGTFVAGVIAGQGVIDADVTGVFPEARLMILRAAPDGDEYDKDVATAIRYAVDNGAKVVNLSIGKYTSPDSAMVNAAIAYALKHDVLLLQAAGNNHIDIDSVPYFPSAITPRGGIYENYIRIGASDSRGGAASMSNYGRNKVDVFAPGVSITSTAPGNRCMTADGTSIAAPIVSAVAAMIRAYYPKLKAGQVKEILVRSSRPTTFLEGKARGGVVDALAAMKMASNY